MQIQVQSTTNGIRLTVGSESHMLPTTDITQLVSALEESLQRCGEWTIKTTPFKAP
jgi:hypothetical protein